MKGILFFLFVFLVSSGSSSLAQNTVTPQILTPLAVAVNESSGLINLDGKIWTHNDSGGQPQLYEISKTDGSILRTVVIQNATNVDWEDLAADSDYVYIGDFGNNSGSRTNLKIYRISRPTLAVSNSVPAETISFSYSDQTSWDPHPNQTDFDCEAVIAYGGFLYLFSKDWVDQKTRVYQLSDQPGTHVAQYLSTFNVLGLVTAAEILPSGVLLLQGYSTSLIPFTWLFQGFSGISFFNGSNIKLNWNTIAQTESISRAGNTSIYITSEKAPNPLPFVATLFYLDLSSYIANPSPVTKTLTLTVFLEGLYCGGSIMNKAQDESGDHFPGDIADKAAVELHNSSDYSLIEYICRSTDLDTSGNISNSGIPGTYNGSYYITVKGRNSLETTTSVPVSFSGNPVTYNFTTSASQAYGNNLNNWNGAGVHVIWGGDVNLDGIVDSGDMNPVENASTAVILGYVAEDVNGDGIVDSGDMNMVENNSTAVIMAQTP